MKYFHRTSVAPDLVMAQAAAFFGGRLTPGARGAREVAFHGPIGVLRVEVAAEGGHYTLVTIVTDQPAESELDRLGKRFLGEVHRATDPAHELRGSY